MSKFNANEFTAKQRETATEAYRNGGKGITSFVTGVLTDYIKLSVRLHLAACVTFYHAMQSGDTRPLNAFFNGLRKNDSDALRIWVGKHSIVEVTTETDVEERKTMGFKKDNGFVVLPKSEDIRVGAWTLDGLFDLPSFQDVDQKAEAAALGLAEILAMLVKAKKTTEKKAEENGVTLPDSIKTLLADIEAGVAKAVTPVVEAQPALIVNKAA